MEIGDPGAVAPVGGFLLASVRAGSPMLVVRALRWWRDLARLGVHLPAFVVHDIGLLYAAPRDQIEWTAPPSGGAATAIARVPTLPELVESYREIVAEIARSERSLRASAMKLGDDIVVVVLARLLSAIGGAIAERPPPQPPEAPALDPELLRGRDGDLARWFGAAPRVYEAAALAALARARLQILTLADALDVDALRVLGMLGPAPGATGALAQVDLLAALASSTTSDIVDFSLELLPNVLETHRARSIGTHAIHGYAGVSRKGSIDSLVLTELAWDELELQRRMGDGELLFYAREQAHDQARRLHYLVIDASASMRGEREVFARGLAIALAKKLELAGEDVWMRFFDSRLYEVHRMRDRTQVPAAWLLGFKGERGRNPARVFAQLASEVALFRARDSRDPIIHLITHAALHVPRALVQEVRQRAHLFAVFILPSGGTLDLEWLDLLEGYAVVDHATLQQRGARAQAASKIVADLSP